MYYAVVKVTNPIGKKGEDEAVTFLQKKGYRVLERNFQGRQGEIDIIAIDFNRSSPSTHSVRLGKNEPVLVFVEVKTRRSAQFGTALESIRHAKLSSIKITSEFFKLKHPKLPEAMRIDAVAVELDEVGQVTSIEHIENIGGF